jgi:MSHA biogenesis protein MshI
MTIAKWFGDKAYKGWTAVEVGPDGVVGVSVRSPATLGAKPGVVKCGMIAGTELTVEAVAALAKQISVPGFGWVFLLDRRDYSILVLQEPSVQSGELEESVRWSVSTLIDYPIASANVSWMRIPTAKSLPNRTPHIYAVVARRDLTESYFDIFQKMQVQLNAIDIKETAQRNIASLVAKPGEGVGLLSVGKRGVYFTVSFNGELYLDRFVEETLFTQNGQGDDARGRAVERIILQVQRSVDFTMRNLPFLDIARILVAPTPGRIDLVEMLSPQVQLKVERIDLAELFDFTQVPELAKEESQASYFFVLGAALRFAKNKP